MTGVARALEHVSPTARFPFSVFFLMATTQPVVRPKTYSPRPARLGRREPKSAHTDQTGVDRARKDAGPGPRAGWLLSGFFDAPGGPWNVSSTH